MLRQREVEAFVSYGFVVVRGAVPQDLIRACQEEVDAELVARGVDPGDRATWTSPVVRFNCPNTPAFAAAGTQESLWSVYDQLLGEGTWQRRQGVGGTIPVRFPHDEDPGDAGWHIDASFEADGKWSVNYRSKGRGLLVLFLLSDVGGDDAPTELKLGSHLEVPKLLRPLGEEGTDFVSAGRLFTDSIFGRRSVLATGQAGDVFICHPFLVHRATWPHRGTRPRAIAQPGVAIHEPFRLDRDAACPVEQAILLGLEE